MKLQLPIWRYQNWCFHVFLFDLVPSFLTLCGPNKRLCFPHQLCDWCHDKGKVLDETYIKLSHTIKNLNLLWICRYWHIYYCPNLVRVWFFPALETINLKINLKNTINTHFFGLKLILHFLHFLKQSLSFIKSLSISL